MKDPVITLDQVRHVARLAALAVDESDLAALQHDLAAILGHMTELAALDTSGVEPTSHPVDVRALLRVDRVEPSLARADVLAAAPEAHAGAFSVPRVLEAEG